MDLAARAAHSARQVERGVDERLDLPLVLGLRNRNENGQPCMQREGHATYLAARCDGARRLAPGVERVLALVVHRLRRRGVDPRPDVAPRAVVQWLLLAPQQACVRVCVKVRGDL